MKNAKKSSPLTTALLAAAVSLTCMRGQAQEKTLPNEEIANVKCPEIVAQSGAKKAGDGGIIAPVPDSDVFIRQVDNILADNDYTDVSGPTLFVDQGSHRFTMIFWQMIALDRHKFVGGDEEYYIWNDPPKSYYKVGAVIFNADASDDTLRRSPTIITYGANPLAQTQAEMNRLPHNQICERPDRFDYPICATYRKNIEILTKRQEAIKESMHDASNKAKAGLHDMLTKINRCAGNWAKYHNLDFRPMP